MKGRRTRSRVHLIKSGGGFRPYLGIRRKAVSTDKEKVKRRLFNLGERRRGEFRWIIGTRKGREKKKGDAVSVRRENIVESHGTVRKSNLGRGVGVSHKRAMRRGEELCQSAWGDDNLGCHEKKVTRECGSTTGARKKGDEVSFNGGEHLTPKGKVSKRKGTLTTDEIHL